MVPPRLASTVVVARPGPAGGFEVLLTQRPEQMRFMGGFYVFPGGTVRDSDYSPAMLERCRGLSGEQARAILRNAHSPEVALGHWVAVVRELYEEVGVLLCRREPQDAAVPPDRDAEPARLEAKRRAVVAGRLSFLELLRSEALVCDLSRLVYFFHRVTPDFYPMRFDTRFYIAALPPRQTALRRSEEVSESFWVDPGQALARAGGADLPILPPTTTVLADLARLRTWERLQGAYGLARAPGSD